MNELEGRIYKDLNDKDVVKLLELGLVTVKFVLIEDPKRRWGASEGPRLWDRDTFFQTYTYIPSYNTPLWRLLNE